jgi:hypothetical protein
VNRRVDILRRDGRNALAAQKIAHPARNYAILGE